MVRHWIINPTHRGSNPLSHSKKRICAYEQLSKDNIMKEQSGAILFMSRIFYSFFI